MKMESVVQTQMSSDIPDSIQHLTHLHTASRYVTGFMGHLYFSGATAEGQAWYPKMTSGVYV